MKVDIYSAIGNPVRCQLITCLSKKSANVTQLISNCGLAQSAVSQHLLKLKKSGLVKTKKVGKEIFYSLKHKKAAKIADFLQKLEQEVNYEK